MTDEQITLLTKLQPKINECMGFLSPFDKFIFNRVQYTFRYVNFEEWNCSDKFGMGLQFINLKIDDIIRVPLAIDPINPERGLKEMLNHAGQKALMKQYGNSFGTFLNDANSYTALLKALCEQQGI